MKSESGFEMGAEFMAEGRKRWEALTARSAAVEAQALEDARKAIDEGARLMKQGVEHAARLSTEWRRMASEWTARAATFGRPQA